jgi:hypothetical protein
VTITLVEYTNAALDAAYATTAGPMLGQVKALSTAPGSQMQRALSDVDAEAERLETDGARLEKDNAELQKALTVAGVMLAATAALITASDNDIEATGALIAIPAVTAKIFAQLAGGLTGAGSNPVDPKHIPYYRQQLSALGVRWNIPNALDFATWYVESPKWIKRMDGWGAGYADVIRKSVLQGIENGWGPKYTAAHLRQLAENIPYYAAENLTRTLQLTSYRDASAAMDNVNGEFIEYKIRVARLDDRTCLSCIDRHGTRLEKGQRVDDHYRGRCTEFYVVQGGPRFPETMQADSTPGNRRFVPWQTGDEWFNSLPESRQKRQASFAQTPAKWNAFQSGTPLNAFVGNHNDDVFGNQVIELSLRQAVSDAAQYYQRNQGK